MSEVKSPLTPALSPKGRGCRPRPLPQRPLTPIRRWSKTSAAY